MEDEMSETPAVPATEAAMRAAWTEVCMVEYRITGDMMKSAQFADRIEKVYRDQVRAETLAETDAYLTRHGYADSAYLLRTSDIPRSGS